MNLSFSQLILRYCYRACDRCAGAALQILVLAWADNRKDLEVVWKLLSQVILNLYCARRTILPTPHHCQLARPCMWDGMVGQGRR